MTQKRIVRALGVLAAVALLLRPSSAQALTLTIDQIIYQNGTGVDPTQFSGTLTVTASGNTLTFVLTNTSADGAVTNSSLPANMLLTGFGVQLPGLDILTIGPGTVSVTSGSTPLNFDVGQSLTDLSDQYVYANQSIDGYSMSGVLTVDTVISSVNNGQATPFSTVPPPPGPIDGPNYGALSNNETQFGLSQAGVQNSVTVVLNLSGTVNAATLDAINAGNVILAFGSPDSIQNSVPDGGMTMSLLGMAMAGLGVMARRKK